eukprot:UN05749
MLQAKRRKIIKNVNKQLNVYLGVIMVIYILIPSATSYQDLLDDYKAKLKAHSKLGENLWFRSTSSH